MPAARCHVERGVAAPTPRGSIHGDMRGTGGEWARVTGVTMLPAQKFTRWTTRKLSVRFAHGVSEEGGRLGLCESQLMSPSSSELRHESRKLW